MTKTYPVIRNYNNAGETWAKKDFTDRNINRNLRNLVRVEIVERGNGEDLTMVYSKAIKEGNMTFHEEEEYYYRRESASDSFYQI